MTALPRIDDEFLINTVCEWPVIYDSNHMNHKDQGILYRVWKEVARDMSYRDDDATPVSGLECKERWKSLRTAYVGVLRREAKQTDGSANKRKPWKHAESMSFLKPYLAQHKKKRQNTTTPNSNAQTSRSSSNTSMTPEDTMDPEYIVPDSELIYIPDDVPELIEINLNDEKDVPESNDLLNLNGSAEKEVPAYIDPLNLNDGNSEKEDGLFSFFKSVIPDVKKLTPKRQLNFKMRVLAELSAFIEEQEEEK